MSDNIQAIDTTFFAPQQNLPGASYIGPSIASYQGILFAAWRGSDDDASIYWSTLNQDGWRPQQRIDGVGTSYMPALAVNGPTLYMAWRGSGDDDGIYFCDFDGTGWTPQQNISGVSTAYGPSLASYGGLLFAAWRGSEDDNGIYYASFDGSSWSAQQVITGVGTSVGPGLATHHSILYAAWRGVDTDNGIYYSTFDGTNWNAQNRIAGVATAIGPSLASFDHRLYVAWRGIDHDNGIYWCTTDGYEGWSAQQSVSGVGTGNRPALAASGGLLFLAWKGANDDQGLYWTSGWSGSVQANWRNGTGNYAGDPEPITRMDLFTMSAATTGDTENFDRVRMGPFQTWAPTLAGANAWDAFSNDWTNLNDRSFEVLGMNPCIPLNVISPNVSMNLVFYVNMTNRVVTINEQNDVYDDSAGEQSQRSIQANYPPLFQPGAPVCAVARTPTELHLFAVGYSGKVFTTDAQLSDAAALPVWTNTWRELGPFGPEVLFLPSTPLVALARDMSSVQMLPGAHRAVINAPGASSPYQYLTGDGHYHLDVFGVDRDGNVQTASWSKEQWPLGTQWTNLGGGFPPGAPVTAVARTAANMDLFVIGRDGHVYTRSWTESRGWSPAWQYIGAYVPRGNAVLALSGQANVIDLYTVGYDGRVYTCTWDNFHGWSGIQQNWIPIGGFFPRNAPISGVCRSPGARDLFIVGNDGKVYTSRLIAGNDWTGSRDNWTPVVVESVTYTQQFLTPKGTALGTTVTLTLYASGTYRYECLTSNTGELGYDFSSNSFYQADGGEVLMLVHSGHVGGALSSGSAQDDYVEYGVSAYVHSMWDQVKNGRLFISEDYELTGIAGLVDRLFTFILDLGAYAAGASLGVVLAISNEAANLLGNFSLGELIGIVAGTAILAFGGTAVLAVVAGYAAGKITQALIKQVELDSNELQFAKDNVFGNYSLPADVKLYKTNLSSPTGRAFTFPAGGRIYLNLGTDAFNDPIHYKNDGAYPGEGQLFIHEMTHAWQIQQSTFLAGQICSGIVIQAEYLVGESVYTYPPPGRPWHDFGVEQQAAIVDQWFAGIPVYGAPNRTGEHLPPDPDLKDPYAQYIKNNIRLSVTT